MPRIFLTLLFVSLSVSTGAAQHDTALRQLIGNQGLTAVSAPQLSNRPLVDLGQSLFFDRELSGNRDVSCATCHHPSLGTGDARQLPAGVGGNGLGPDRTQAADREIVPRNAPEVFHRGDSDWSSMFWDSRVAKSGNEFTTPAGPDLPGGLDNVLAAQAMFPVTSRAEMRGNAGDVDLNGSTNELANIPDNDLPGIWSAITQRLMNIPAYRTAFEKAYPDTPVDQIGFQHAANAIAAFETDAFSKADSAWDRYLQGDDSALTESAKRGATHFLSGNCSSCHSGRLFTDQQHHNIGVPQLGPGKDPVSHLDLGRAVETGEQQDEFAFRTPPLRNVVVTGPWMHNGAFSDLESVIRHKYDPQESLATYDVNQLPEFLRSTAKLDAATIDRILASLDPMLPVGDMITDDQINDLMAFMFSLTSPSIDKMLRVTPQAVLSSLDVETLPPSEIAVQYNPTDGMLKLIGNPDLQLDAFFLRIDSDEESDSGFSLKPDMAPWSSDEDIVLSNEADAQSYIDYRRQPTMLLTAGDELPGMLPEGISAESIGNHLFAAYRIKGSPVLWTADVVFVPEPSNSSWIAILGALWVLGRRRSRFRRK